MNNKASHLRPKLSILMTVHNGRRSISRALTSVKSLPNQLNWELIVCDDGSNDETGKFVIRNVPEDRLVYIKFDRAGHIARARNRTLRWALGEYVVVLDADDILIPQGIVAQVVFLENNPDFGWCHAPAFIYDKFGRWAKSYLLSIPDLCAEGITGWYHDDESKIYPIHPIHPIHPISVPDDLFKENLAYSFINNWGCVIRSSVIRAVEGWSEDIPGNGCGEDYDLNLKLAKRSPSKWIPVISYGFTQNKEASRKKWDTVDGKDLGPFANYGYIRNKFREHDVLKNT